MGHRQCCDNIVIKCNYYTYIYCYVFQGDKGHKGDSGPMGLPGAMGYRGESGPVGPNGRQGMPVSIGLCDLL